MADRRPRPHAIELKAVYYRYSNYDTPFWARPNTRPGRWHSTGMPATQYLSSSVDGAWAELIRAETLVSEEEVSMVRMPLWQARIDVAGIADLSTSAAVEAAGLNVADLTADDHGACRVEGDRLREEGFRGVLAPSAALPGELSLILFGARRAIDWHAEARLASAIPASVVTVGSPPAGLVDRVRRRGQSD